MYQSFGYVWCSSHCNKEFNTMGSSTPGMWGHWAVPYWTEKLIICPTTLKTCAYWHLRKNDCPRPLITIQINSKIFPDQALIKYVKIVMISFKVQFRALNPQPSNQNLLLSASLTSHQPIRITPLMNLGINSGQV